MKALIKAKAEPGVWMAEVAKPTIGPNDVLIRIKKTAICGTDMHIFQWDDWAQRTIKVPMTFGHEYCGEIVEIGSEVRGLELGDRVSGEGHVTCGHCRNCRAGRRHLCRNTVSVGVNRAGCFAEFMSLPATNVFKLPAAITDEFASILDPLGNATHTALSFNLVGEDVLIAGAGPIGAMPWRSRGTLAPGTSSSRTSIPIVLNWLAIWELHLHSTCVPRNSRTP